MFFKLEAIGLKKTIDKDFELANKRLPPADLLYAVDPIFVEIRIPSAYI